MRVDLALDVVVLSDEWALSLFLFGFVGRHRVLPDNRTIGDFSTWLRTRSPDVREFIQHAIDWATHEEASAPSAHCLDVAFPPSRAGQILPSAAIELMQRPYRVLLEDGIRDRDFLLRMCSAHEASFLRDWMTREWLEMEHGGGNTRMLMRLKELAMPPRHGRLLSVLFDSEASTPGDPSTESERLRRLCVRRNIHHHQLQRRAIENYLPRSAFNRWISSGTTKAQRDERRERCDAQIFSLGQAEQHHLRMKDVAGDFGALFADDSAMNPSDIVAEGGPAELQPFVSGLIASVR